MKAGEVVPTRPVKAARAHRCRRLCRIESRTPVIRIGFTRREFVPAFDDMGRVSIGHVVDRRIVARFSRSEIASHTVTCLRTTGDGREGVVVKGVWEERVSMAIRAVKKVVPSSGS